MFFWKGISEHRDDRERRGKDSVFTGLVQGVGRVIRVVRNGREGILDVDAPFLKDPELGESIALNGVCLTVSAFRGAGAEFFVSGETLARTTLGFLAQGDPVNLERALRLSDRLGGHLVSGHVDSIGTILIRTSSSSSIRLRVQIPKELTKFLVVKGSVALDGVSLTVNECGPTYFEVNLVPHTVNRTTLQFCREGDRVNIETDLIGKYVERLLRHGGGADVKPHPGGLSLESLAKYGFVSP